MTGDPTPATPAVSELRLVVTAADWEAAVALYRDALGLPQVADFSGEQGRVVLLEAGRATIEVMDAEQAAFVDGVEVGRRVAPALRVALRVPDAAATTRRLAEGGGGVVG